MENVELTIKLPADTFEAVAALAEHRGQSSEQLIALMVSGVIREIVLKKIEREYFDPDETPSVEGW
jgi:hypothetical protein